MKSISLTRAAGRRRTARMVIAVATCVLLLAASASPAFALPKANRYTVRNLVSDTTAIPALRHDPNLVNAWGLAAGPATPWWVADNGTDLSTLYESSGTIVPRVFKVDGGPTGIVFNPTTEFVIAETMPPAAESTSAARFLFATEGGTIRGWNPGVPAAGSTEAVVAVDRSSVGAVYKGLTMATWNGKHYLYATDFHNGRVDVFDGSFTLQSMPGRFRDRRLPKGYAPFGIQALGGMIFVTYAKQKPDRHDEVDGQGLGFVDAYRPDGTWIRRVATRGQLNAPWGLAVAPSGFGRFGGHLLVGNFGDGKILAYRMTRRGFVPAGSLRKRNGKRIVIKGLWGIAFGNGGPSGPRSTLFFASGPFDESHGLFGTVTK